MMAKCKYNHPLVLIPRDSKKGQQAFLFVSVRRHVSGCRTHKTAHDLHAQGKS